MGLALAQVPHQRGGISEALAYLADAKEARRRDRADVA
jgi:hypothetical protein